jgi:hypothetical protein
MTYPGGHVNRKTGFMTLYFVKKFVNRFRDDDFGKIFTKPPPPNNPCTMNELGVFWDVGQICPKSIPPNNPFALNRIAGANDPQAISIKRDVDAAFRADVVNLPLVRRPDDHHLWRIRYSWWQSAHHF